MIRAALYYRVSTEDQTVEHQRGPCRDLCERNGWSWIPEHEIEETGSGASKRPGWDRIMELATAGKVQRVVTWALDRVGRSLWMTCDAIRALDAAGVPLVTVQEPWLQMSDNMIRGVLVTVFSYIADHERQRLIARTKEGLATARRYGRVGGRARTIGGAALAHALELRNTGKSWGEVTAAVNAAHKQTFKRSTVSRAVQRLINDVS